MNDVFFIEGIKNYPKSTLNIYNRWGNKVHYAKGYQNDWAGTWNDSPLPDGTYFYRLDLEDGSGTIHSGYIEIFR
jgi:gliding motility-associated-like protein